jgi:serine/threonine protein kinase
LSSNVATEIDAGSLDYMAPEVLSGKLKGAHNGVDIWACGVMLFAMVCGQLPFPDQHGKKTFDRIIAGQYTFPPKLELSKEVKDLISRILTIDPKERLTGAEILTHPWVLGNKMYR